MLGGVDVGNSAATDAVGNGVGHELPSDEQDTGRPWPTDEFVWGEKDGVLVGQWVLDAARIHVDVDIGTACGVVPECESRMLVQECADRVRVGDDAGHVAGGAEGADQQRAVAEFLEPLAKDVQIQVPVGVLGDRDHIGDGFPPGELVAVVFVGADEDHGSFRCGHVIAEVVLVVEVGWYPKPEQADDFVDSCGRPGAAEDQTGLVAGVDGLLDARSSILPKPRCLKSGSTGFGVGVCVSREHLVTNEFFDESESASGGGVVGVGDTAGTEGTVHHVIVTDHGFADPVQNRPGREIVTRWWNGLACPLQVDPAIALVHGSSVRGRGRLRRLLRD